MQNNYLYQFWMISNWKWQISDGYIEDGQFEDRINKVINSSKQFMITRGCENLDGSFIYHS